MNAIVACLLNLFAILFLRPEAPSQDQGQYNYPLYSSIVYQHHLDFITPQRELTKKLEADIKTQKEASDKLSVELSDLKAKIAQDEASVTLAQEDGSERLRGKAADLKVRVNRQNQNITQLRKTVKYQKAWIDRNDEAMVELQDQLAKVNKSKRSQAAALKVTKNLLQKLAAGRSPYPQSSPERKKRAVDKIDTDRAEHPKAAVLDGKCKHLKARGRPHQPAPSGPQPPLQPTLAIEAPSQQQDPSDTVMEESDSALVVATPRPQQASSGFGSSGFGSSGFGSSGFGSSGFGSSSFGAPSSQQQNVFGQQSAPSGSAFGAPAHSSSSPFASKTNAALPAGFAPPKLGLPGQQATQDPRRGSPAFNASLNGRTTDLVNNPAFVAFRGKSSPAATPAATANNSMVLASTSSDVTMSAYSRGMAGPVPAANATLNLGFSTSRPGTFGVGNSNANANANSAASLFGPSRQTLKPGMFCAGIAAASSSTAMILGHAGNRPGTFGVGVGVGDADDSDDEVAKHAKAAEAYASMTKLGPRSAAVKPATAAAAPSPFGDDSASAAGLFQAKARKMFEAGAVAVAGAGAAVESSSSAALRRELDNDEDADAMKM
jgi:hypothetical protein